MASAFCDEQNHRVKRRKRRKTHQRNRHLCSFSPPVLQIAKIRRILALGMGMSISLVTLSNACGQAAKGLVLGQKILRRPMGVAQNDITNVVHAGEALRTPQKKSPGITEGLAYSYKWSYSIEPYSPRTKSAMHVALKLSSFTSWP